MSPTEPLFLRGVRRADVDNFSINGSSTPEADYFRGVPLNDSSGSNRAVYSFARKAGLEACLMDLTPELPRIDQ